MIYKFFTIISLFVILTIAEPLLATVEPSTESMVDRSGLVVVGKIVSVEHPGQPLRVVTVKTERILKATSAVVKGRFKFEYKRFGKANIDFLKLAKEQKDHVLYLRQVGFEDSMSLKLSDEWFGIEESTPELVNKIQQIIAKNQR